MTVERPTFHEAWYRIAELRPRLANSVRVYRQHFRGQMWFVLENTVNNKFSRLSSEAYRFVGMLDGRRTVAEVWESCNEHLGDDAPTQGEVIELLGQLHCSNLLYAELAPDTESLFNRYRKRIGREVQGYLMNILFVRIPLLDPDRFLERWVGVFGRVFSWYGFIFWSILIAAGLYFVIGNIGELVYQSSEVLAPGNLLWLYLSLVFVKVLHEFGHAFACKRFGKVSGSGGEVHVMGVMFLVFFPLPYMDASSAWAFRHKVHRAVVGAAGMLVELAMAAAAAIVWANTSTGTLHIIAYNIIFVASISTLLFNGNPLLRFDGYYILSDLLEIPNLGQRSKIYLYYLVRRYCWAVKRAQNPARTNGERFWFVFYAISSTAYRVYICIRILLFLNRRLPEELSVLVPLFAAGAVIAWVLVPVGRFLQYLFTGGELARTRSRAVASTFAALAVSVLALGVLPVPDHCRVEGVVEPASMAIVYAAGDGFVTDYLPSEYEVSGDGVPLVKAVNPKLEASRKSLLAEKRVLEVRRRLAELQEIAGAQIMDEQIEALKEQIARVEYELSSLSLQPPLAGTWVAPDIDSSKGMYLRRGQQIGFVGTLDDVLVRSTAGQAVAAMLVEQAYKQVEIRAKGRPSVFLTGQIDQIYPAGQEQLPYEALGFPVGGDIPTRSRDVRDKRAAEKFFEVKIKPDPESSVKLHSGQRVVARIRMPSKPLAAQWWRSLRQLFQRRFHI